MAIKPHAFGTTGAIPTPIDLRDYKLGSVQPPVDHPPVFMQDVAWNAPIDYQRDQPACGAHAAALFKYILDSYEAEGRHYSPRFTWAHIKTFDGHPVEVGTDLRSIMKSLAQAGAADFDLAGNNSELSLAEYASTVVLTPKNKKNAFPRAISTYALEARPSFEKLKKAIYLHKAVIIRMEIGDNWYTDTTGKVSWAEKDILPLRDIKSPDGGHFVTAHSYDEKYIYFANEWSTKWGKAGHGYFGAEHMKYVTDYATAVDIPDHIIERLEYKKELLTMLLSLWKRLRGIA